MNRLASFTTLGLALAVAACGGPPSAGDDDGVVPPDAREIDAPLDAPLPMVGPEVDGKLVINEVMAINALSGTDATGAAGDWLEIYNPTAVDISLQNYAVTDDLMAPRKHIIGGGKGTTILGSGATTGVGSAFLPAALTLGIGGGGGGTSRISKVLSCSTVRVTLWTVRPERMIAAKSACTMATPPSAFIRSGLSAAR